MSLHYTALVTWLSVLLQIWIMVLVGHARGRYGVQPPATTGNPDFERTLRVQVNTVEALLMFLPSLWLFGYYLSDCIGAGIGLIWLLGRVLYALGYQREAKQRSRGFLISFVAVGALVLGSGYGLLRALLA